MITSFLLSISGTFATEDMWSGWNDILSDTFGDNTWLDDSIGGDSFTDFIWDQIDFGDATDEASSSLFEGWLTGIDMDDYLSDTQVQLEGMLDSLGDTSDMSTEEIVEALNNAGFDPADYGWDANANLEDVLDEMSQVATDMEVMSWMEGWDLDEFPALDGLESTLEDFGFDDLWSLEDINSYLETDVEDILPNGYTEYQTQLDAIEAGLTEIMNGDSDAPDMDSVLSDIQSMINSMQTDVNNGATDLTEPLENLENVYDVLSYFDMEPTDMLAQMAEDMESLFEDTDYDYGGLDDTLGSDWLSNFETAMQELSGSIDYEVCEDNFVKTTLSAQYDTPTAYGLSCYQLVALNVLDCTCLNNAGIYGNTDKEDVQESLMCLLNEDDDLTVEQTLRECNGEDVEMDTTLDAFELLDELTSQLTLDNFVDMDEDLVDTDELSERWEDIISGIEELSNTEIDTDGTMEDYRDSLSDWIDNLESLVDDLDIDGSYTEQGQDISDMLDDALSAFEADEDDTDRESDETASSNKEDDGTEWWVWLLAAVAVFLVICLICGVTVYQKNRKLSRLAIGIESETYAQVEGDAPLVPAANAGTTAGEGEM